MLSSTIEIGYVWFYISLPAMKVHTIFFVFLKTFLLTIADPDLYGPLVLLFRKTIEIGNVRFYISLPNVGSH
jgi:hypothetical protein